MNVMGTDPIWGVTEGKLEEWWKEDEQSALQKVEPGSQATVVVVTGFVASTLQAWKRPPPGESLPPPPSCAYLTAPFRPHPQGTPTTLKRSGSDYSATIFAKLMRASKITMWKNVDGVYTADPRRVPEAFPIDSLKFDEVCLTDARCSHRIPWLDLVAISPTPRLSPRTPPPP